MLKRTFFVLLILLVATTSLSVMAQNIVTLTVAVPSFSLDSVRNDIVPAFEAEYPSIKVTLVSSDNAPIYGPGSDIEDYLDSFGAYANSADVLAISPNNIGIEATRAGYLLDLAPLINTDQTFNPDDFYPAIYQSFQWDGGFWAMPVSGDVIVMIYAPDAFDAAGLEYPAAWWTLDDLENAIRELTVYDEAGNVTLPGLLDTGDADVIFQSLLNDNFYDELAFPTLPKFDNPALPALMEQWAQIRRDGLLELPAGQFSFESPMIVSQSLLVSAANLGGSGTSRQIALLPGGKAGVTVNAAAISAGTQNPEAAYTLVKYLTTNPDVQNAFLGQIPARRSMEGVEAEGLLSELLQTPEELKPTIALALENAIPVSENRFGDYVISAISQMASENVDANTALEDAEAESVSKLQAADARRPDVQVFVAEPTPAPQLDSGEVSFKFGILSFTPTPADLETWQTLAADFAAADPLVGDVVVEVKVPFPSASLSDMSEAFDCYYMPNNYIPGADLTLLRSIDPLLSSDPTFNSSDMVSSVMEQVRRNDQTWGMPLIVQPQALWYDPELFGQAGAPLPFFGWTVADFENSLRILKDQSGDKAPFASRDFDGSHVLVLIAAYGGLPLDYRTSPVTIHYTDPATIEATRQVLNLAKDGLIQYNALGSTGAATFNFGAPEATALYSQLVNPLFQFGPTDADSPYVLTTFPQGFEYSAISYDVGVMYISANTQNTEACYNFASKVAQNADLFSGMPARRSLIGSQNVVTEQGQDAVDYYNAIDGLFAQSNTIAIPSGTNADISSAGNTLVLIWLYRAWDNYVLNDADLETEMETAQLYAVGYQECAAQIPPFNPALEEALDYLRKFLQCGVLVDPSLQDTFGPLLGE